jgi:hypothetical protein
VFYRTPNDSKAQTSGNPEWGEYETDWPSCNVKVEFV